MKGHEHHFENLSKLKNIDTKLMYNGVTHTKGLADDEVRILLSFTGYVRKNDTHNELGLGCRSHHLL